MFRKMPFVMIASIMAIMVLDPFMPIFLKQVLYSISMSIKSIIVLFLPFVIFALLFKAAVQLSRNATKVIGIILVLVCISNAISTFLSHNIGVWIYSFDLSVILPEESYDGLQVLWSFEFPKLIANNHAMFAGIISGIILAKFTPKRAKSLAGKFEIIVGRMLASFIYFIPLFIMGFIVKLQHDGAISIIIKDYLPVIALIALSAFGYIILLFLLLNKFNGSKALSNIKNMIPASITGFSSMSSAASMPLTMIGAAANAKNKDLARSIIPATVNIHLIGDCFAIPIFAYAVLKSFGMPEPSMVSYLVFTFYFVIAKFSVAAIPGGGIIVMLPVLESYLGFNAEMMSLITALYILFDPVITGANVFGNGAFAKLVDSIYNIIIKPHNITNASKGEAVDALSRSGGQYDDQTDEQSKIGVQYK